MRVLSHPLRLDGAGAFATVEQDTPAEAGQLALVVLSTLRGERLLAPDHGILDPSGAGLSVDAAVSALALCEPLLQVDAVESTLGPEGQQELALAVSFIEEA